MILTGLAVFLVAEVPIPGLSRRFAAVLAFAVAVLLVMLNSQKSELPELRVPLCVQVNVINNSRYVPGPWWVSANYAVKLCGI